MSDAIVTPEGLFRLFVLTLRDPARAAGYLIALNLSRAVLWQALALVTVIGVLIAAFSPAPLPDPGPGAGADPVVLTPFAYAVVLGAMLVMLVISLHSTGVALGGSGTFSATLTLVVWLEVVATAVRLAQALSLAVSPLLGAIVSLAGFGVLFWTLLNFIKVLHGFGSLGRAVLTLFIGVTGIIVVMILILSLIGAGPAGGPFDV